MAPKDMEKDTIFRLKLTTDMPPTTHLSGKLQISYADAASSSSMRMVHPENAELSVINMIGVVLVVVISLVGTCWLTTRLRRKSQRIVLE
jgi:hypothetical protein